MVLLNRSLLGRSKTAHAWCLAETALSKPMVKFCQGARSGGPNSANRNHGLVPQTITRTDAIETEFELAFPRLLGSLRRHPVERKKAGLFIAPRRGLRRKCVLFA